MSSGTGTKRKNDENLVPVVTKKVRGKAAGATQTAPQSSAAAALVDAVLANPVAYPVPASEDAVRQSLLGLASYARALEQQVATLSGAASQVSVASSGGQVMAPAKSQEELASTAERIRRAAQSGIKQQMKWRPSCKTGSAKWTYDGICPHPEVFGVLMGLGGPPTFKMKKFPVEEFEKLIGPCRGSARYATLYITGNDVNVRWYDTGEFKFSGTYGKMQY
ncbi:hypothetical protein BD414DRAFT_461329 [Trametes punicea]|nr:hypothetical protein BD414DRAFT_461329 [Trametes punicea]